jgi:CheY-like chemotaxis protein
VLDRLKRDPATRHIPVHVMTRSRERERILARGAKSCLHKPLGDEQLDAEFARIQAFQNRSRCSLLIVEDEPLRRSYLVQLISAPEVDVVAVASAPEALDAMCQARFDCMVLNPGLGGMDGFALLDRIADDASLRDMPVVIYPVADLRRKEVMRLKRMARTIVLKEVCTPQRVLDQTVLFLHRAQASLPEGQRRMLECVHAEDGALMGRKVLIVDDDLRNIFALSSVLEREHMNVLFAENGKDGIAVLEQDPDIEIVLMDIMMPEMDGYDTMRAIRRVPRFAQLPIITLTAKAMKGDRDKCLAAGASDYITKPVDVIRLLALVRVWLRG